MKAQVKFFGAVAAVAIALVSSLAPALARESYVVDDASIAARAARQSLWIWPLSGAYLGQEAHPGFILGFGSTAAADIPAAVRKLRNLLTSG